MRFNMQGKFATAAMVATASFSAVAMAGTTAQAQQQINFGGTVRVLNNPGSGGSELLLDFLKAGQLAGLGQTGTTTAQEVIDDPFASNGVSVGTTGDIVDLVANNSGFTGLPVAPFVTMGGYTFTINSADPGSTFGPISLAASGPRNTVAFFSFLGNVTGPGIQGGSQQYSGVFSAQFNGTPTQVFAAINGGGTRSATYSATFTLIPNVVVPEPSTYALMGSGLAGLLVAARRRRSAV